jgi:hypothetical protein
MSSLLPTFNPPSPHQAHYSHHALGVPPSSSPKSYSPQIQRQFKQTTSLKMPNQNRNTSGIISRSNSIKLQGGHGGSNCSVRLHASRPLCPPVHASYIEPRRLVEKPPFTSRQGRIMHDKVIPSSTEWGGRACWTNKVSLFFAFSLFISQRASRGGTMSESSVCVAPM